MRFDNRTISPRVSKAVQIAEKLFEPDSKMISDLYNKNDFEFNSGDGHEVCKKILESHAVSKIYFYKPFNPLTRAIGYRDSKGIHINVRKFDSLTEADLVGLLGHEHLHDIGFGHGNNYKTDFKCKFSVNYFVSENILRWL